MGILSGLTKTTQTGQLKPWGPAAGHMTNYMGQLAGMPTMQAFGGNYAADMNPMYAQALQAGNNWGNTLMSQGRGLYDQGMGMFNKGMGDYQAMLETQRVAGPRQFQYDQGLFDQTLNNFMPGLEAMVGAQGRMSSMGLQSNLGQLVSQAGQSGSLGGNPMSKLGQGSAALQAQNTLNNQMFAGNLYNQAAGMGNANAMSSGAANLQSGQMYDSNMLGGYANIANMGRGLGQMGLGMQGTGMDAMNFAGSNMQKYDQFARDMQRQQFMDRQTIPMQDIQNRLGVFSNLSAQFGKNKQTQSGSPLDGLMKGVGAIGGIAGSVYSMPGMGGLFGGGAPSGGFASAFSPANMQANALMQQPGYSYTGGY